MKRSWLIDYKGIATIVKNAGLSPAYQIKACRAYRDCPKCHYRIDNSDVSQEWPGLPAGVKFDPSDVQLLEHLAAKCRLGRSEPHKFIEEFIPTLEHLEGICYTHPENLPGAKKDGSSVHFFHKTINAYAIGQRKRRKIHNQCSSTKEETRWHKTGKTKPVMENGVQKGCKKIMVLHTTSKKGCKSYKSNWVFHQYHLGTDENEVQERFVVSKVFFQPQKQPYCTESSHGIEESEVGSIHDGPRTAKTHAPNTPLQETEVVKDTSRPSSSDPPFMNEMETYTWLEGESQDTDGNGMNHDSLLYNRDRNPPCGIADLESLELDTPLGSQQLADLSFGSQDSSWLDPF